MFAFLLMHVNPQVHCSYLSGETIGMCVGGMACSVLVGRLVGGLGLSGLFSKSVSVAASSALEATLRFSANRWNGNLP